MRKPRNFGPAMGGIVIAQNLPSEAEVDAMMARAEAAGARILKQAAKAFWGAMTATSQIQTDVCGRSLSIRLGNSMRMARVRLPD
jgi:hypothetical protein